MPPGKGGENDHLNAVKKYLCAKVIKENRDTIVGVKVRLDKNITDDGMFTLWKLWEHVPRHPILDIYF